MANVSRAGSVDEVFNDCFNRIQRKAKTGDQFKVGGSFNVGFAKFDVAYVDQAEELTPEPFERCLSLLRSAAGNRNAFIVIENIESIIEDENHVKSIAGLLTLVDDEDYAKYNVKILVVGVPDDIQRYLSKTRYGATIANRVTEIPEVSRLSLPLSIQLLSKGFSDLLKYKVSEDVSLSKIVWYTDCIPQHLHELGFEIACLAQPTRVVSDSLIEDALYNWVTSTLMNDYTTIEAKMNSRETRTGRRNQTLYSIGKWSSDNLKATDFRAADIEKTIRSEFPRSTFETTLNVNQMLTDLAAAPRPVIRRTPNGDAYRFISPKLRVCIRAMLIKDKNERIKKRSQIGMVT